VAARRVHTRPRPVTSSIIEILFKGNKEYVLGENALAWRRDACTDRDRCTCNLATI